MKKIILISVAVLATLNLSAWGRLGHDAIAYIAECNLTPKAKKTVMSYLDGKSIVYYSAWMDDVRETPEYGYTTTWHTAAVDEKGEPYMGKNVSPDKYRGDAVLELVRLIEKMQDYKALDDSTVAVGIKMIVHLAGDMHCPGHVKYPGIKGFNVTFFGKKVSYHSVWDDGLIGSRHKWHYMEYNHQLGGLSKKEAASISAGDPVSWERENAACCRVIYDWAKPNDSIGKDFVNTAIGLADSQIQKAGYRLAAILNSIFG